MSIFQCTRLSSCTSVDGLLALVMSSPSFHRHAALHPGEKAAKWDPVPTLGPTEVHKRRSEGEESGFMKGP